MQIGIIGLGRMGFNMTRRLLQGGHTVVVYNRTGEKVESAAKEGAVPSSSVEELVEKLDLPRTVLVMLPAGEVTDTYIRKLSTFLTEGDLIIDGGNTYYKDDMRRLLELKHIGIRYMDAGISGGIWGLQLGYCTMVGGNKEDFERVEPLFKSLAPEGGYLYCGPSGAGHFVKMVHNGIEYALMEAYGEGFEILDASPYKETLDHQKIAHLWNQGSVIRSWLLELLEKAFRNDPGLNKIRGFVDDSGEGRWTVQQAVETGVPATTIAHALFKRFQSRNPNLFSDRLLAALRKEFGGHDTKSADE